MSFRKGSKVWTEDIDSAWVEAEVLDVRGKLVVISMPKGKKVTISPEKLLPRDPEADHGGVDDMTKLTYLNEPGVLYNLARRYSLNEIYYKGAKFGELSPHVFAVADASYRAMVNEAHSQSILVSGESGAGKTETTKLIMQYLANVGGRTTVDDRSVEQQVLEFNPLLEAFGNARTIRNDNSSRFGKFVEIQFDERGRISGAAIRTYLLERSRVVQISDPERNYHCFYQLCASEKVFKSPVKCIGPEDSVSRIDVRYPAILFKQQLTASLEKIFGLIRDNLKKELSPLLSLCIQAPKSTRTSAGKSSKSLSGVAQQSMNSHWDSIIKFLDSFMSRLRQNYVPSFFIRKLTTQVFSSVNNQLFNSLLLRRECCTFSNGEYMKSGLALLEKWIADATDEFAGTSWHELNCIRQAVGFLVIHQKRRKSLEEIKHDLCPALSVEQIYRICKMYWDDKYNTESVSKEVVATMRDTISRNSQLSQGLTSNTFLLDDDLSIPFLTDDISKAIPVIDPADVKVPPSLLQFPSAQFLV